MTAGNGQGVPASPGVPAWSLSEADAERVAAGLAEWQSADKTRRLWERDASLWTGGDEADWLGWLSIVDAQLGRIERLREISDWARSSDHEHLLLLGMGGSSLWPDVMTRTFGRRPGFPELTVLDSTDPGRIRAVEAGLDLARTLVLVASKSGTTLEPNILMAHFFERLREQLGADGAGRRFVAVTDPGSELERVAGRDGFRRIFHGVPEIGGRYSALSDFGMVPAAIMGLDVERLLGRAAAMAAACGPDVAAPESPGVALGVVLGEMARAGRDKLTLIATPAVAALGAWIEQLVAESTGKAGVAILPIDGECPAAPAVYGDDRLFVHLRLDGEARPDEDLAVERLAAAGMPVLRLTLADRHDLAAELFRWEMATAVAGSVLGIHPFDQPDVEAAKVAARELTTAYEESGELPSEPQVAADGGLRLFAPGDYGERLAATGADGSVAALLAAHLATIAPGDYFAILAYLEMCPRLERPLQELRHRVRDARRVATSLGWGPRYLHSTGQAHKGGPNRGVFLQITCDPEHDLPVPGRRYTFGVVEAAQARGDFRVLAERGRRALRVHLRGDVEAGLARLGELTAAALESAGRDVGAS